MSAILEQFGLLMQAFDPAFGEMNFLIIPVAVLLGLVVGAIPGLTGTMALALLINFTYGMAKYAAVGFMLGCYVGAVSGGLFSDVTTNTDGFVTAATPKADDSTNKVDVFTATGTAKAEEGVIKLGSDAYIYDDATVVYKVAANGTITKSSIAAVKADDNDTVIGYTTKGVLTMVVIKTVAN